MNKLKKIFGNWMLFIILTLILWAMGTVIAWDWNPAHWWGLGRFIAAFIELSIIVKSFFD